MIGLVTPTAEWVTPPFDDTHVAVYCVTVAPLFALAANDTVTGPVAVVVEPDTAFTAVGAAGAPTVTAGDGVDGRLVPRAFVALTVHV